MSDMAGKSREVAIERCNLERWLDYWRQSSHMRRVAVCATGLAALGFHSRLAKLNHYPFSLISMPLDGYPVVHRKKANSY